MFAGLKADLEKRLAVARAAKQSQNARGCGSEAALTAYAAFLQNWRRHVAEVANARLRKIHKQT